MRANIFDRLRDSGYDTHYEIYKIHKLFDEKIGRRSVKGRNNFTPSTLEELVDMFQFANWKQRGSLLSLAELKARIGLSDIWIKLSHITKTGVLDAPISVEDIDATEMIILIEYMLNVANMAYVLLKRDNHYNFEKHSVELDSSKYFAILENIDILLGHLNLEQHHDKKTERIIIVEKSAVVTAVAEIVKNDLFFPTIEYNHNLLRGNIIRKREILLKFADELEPKKVELQKCNSDLADNIFALFNSVNIRHNNSDSSTHKYYNPLIEAMSNKDIEKWYDEAYQLSLYSILTLDNQSRLKQTEELRQALKIAKSQQEHTFSEQ